LVPSRMSVDRSPAPTTRFRQPKAQMDNAYRFQLTAFTSTQHKRCVLFVAELFRRNSKIAEHLANFCEMLLPLTHGPHYTCRLPCV
jgi:hypothetical protein